MRKYILSLLTVLALSLFTVMAAAQTPGGTTGINQSSGNNEGNSNSWNINKSASQSSAPVTGSATDPYSVHSADNANQQNSNNSSSSNSAISGNQNGSSSGMNSSNPADTSNGAKTLEGCVVKENTDYFIQPATGERERLTGSQDLSSSVGKNVRVEGSEQNSSASASTPNAGTTTSEQMPNSGSTETQNNAAGSIAGNAGSPNATGTAGNSASNSSATGGANNTWTGKDFLVTKVSTISESCPADIQNKINQQSNSSSNPQ